MNLLLGSSESLVESFCDSYFDLHQISQPRRRAQRALLLRWVKWLDEIGADVRAVDHETIDAWMTVLIRQGYSPNTVRFYLGMLKPFYRWAHRNGKVSDTAALAIAEVEPPRGAVVNGVPRPYSRAEIQALWRAIAERNALSPEKRLARFRRGTVGFRLCASHGRRLQLEAIVSLALFMGLRRNEIWTLTLDALHPDNDSIVVQGKREDQREKVRELPYSDAARQAVREWFRFRRWMAPSHDHAWLRLRNPGPEAAISHTTFKSLLAPMGFEYHRLRHTCATERLRAGMPIEVLSKFLGHATIQQTLVYAEIVRDDVATSMDKTEGDFLSAVARQKEKIKLQIEDAA